MGTGTVQNRPVECLMLPMDWLFAETEERKTNGFAQLLAILKNSPHDSVFNTDVLLMIIDRYIRRYQRYVIFGNFLPFVVYMTLSLYYIE